MTQLPGELRAHFATTASSPSKGDQASAGDIYFEPELSTQEQKLLDRRHAYVQKMTAELVELQGYLDNVTQLGEDFGASTAGVPLPPKHPVGATSSLNDDLIGGKKAEALYMEHLDAMSGYVAGVQGRLDEIHKDLAGARGGQDELYDACQQVCIYVPG